MEEHKLREALELAKSIQALQRESNDIQSQLDEGDWSDNENEFQPADLPSTEDEQNDDDNDSGTKTESEKLHRELHEFKSKAMELNSVDKDIDRLSESFHDSDINVPNNSSNRDFKEALHELIERIDQLESENANLNSQLESHKSILVGKTLTDLDPEILEFLDQHRNDFTLPFLGQTLEVLIEVKAKNPEKNLSEHLKDLRNCRSNYVAQLAELKIAKKEAEIKLQHMKRRYEEELSSFNDLRIEHIFKNSGAKEYLTGLREKNRLNDEIISKLKTELDSKRNEVSLWKNKFREAEQQSNVYCQAWKDTQVRKEQLEAEKGLHQEWDRRAIDESFNMTSASASMDSQIPPPPPINVPSVEEILRSNSGHSSAPNPYGMPMSSSIPPPPPVDVPLSEILQYPSKQHRILID